MSCIPIKCVTCGKVLADKYLYYKEQAKSKKLQKNGGNPANIDKTVFFTTENMEKTAEGIVLDDLCIFKACCRRTMLTHVDIE